MAIGPGKDRADLDPQPLGEQAVQESNSSGDSSAALFPWAPSAAAADASSAPPPAFLPVARRRDGVLELPGDGTSCSTDGWSSSAAADASSPPPPAFLPVAHRLDGVLEHPGDGRSCSTDGSSSSTAAVDRKGKKAAVSTSPVLPPGGTHSIPSSSAEVSTPPPPQAPPLERPGEGRSRGTCWSNSAVADEKKDEQVSTHANTTSGNKMSGYSNNKKKTWSPFHAASRICLYSAPSHRISTPPTVTQRCFKGNIHVLEGGNPNPAPIPEPVDAPDTYPEPAAAIGSALDIVKKKMADKAGTSEGTPGYMSKLSRSKDYLEYAKSRLSD